MARTKKQFVTYLTNFKPHVKTTINDKANDGEGRGVRGALHVGMRQRYVTETEKLVYYITRR